MNAWIKPAGLFLLLAMLCVTEAGRAGGEKLKPGPMVDIKGTKQTPLEVRGAKAVVLFFVVTDCPIANYFASEINAIAKDFTPEGVRFFVVHIDPDLSPEDAGKHAKEFGLTCPVLIDAKHELVKATGATITPEAVVLTPDGKIAYRGRIDDRYIELAKRRVEPNRRDVRVALNAVLAGEPVKEARTKAIGCPIPALAAERKP